MKCFVAGTLILTAAGLVAIENIKAGDKVIATNPETFEVAEKTVLETYVRETMELLHLRRIENESRRFVQKKQRKREYRLKMFPLTF